MLTHTITLSFSLSATFNSLWKRQVQTLIEPEPDLAPALSVRPAVLSNPLRSMSSQPGSQQAGSQASSQSTRLHPAGRGGLRLPLSPRYSRASLGSLGRPQRGIAQCQAQSLQHWCRMCCRQDWEGTPKACWTSTHFPFTTPANTTFPPRTPPLFLQAPLHLHLYWTPAPSLPLFLPPSLLFSLSFLAPSILELLWFGSLSFPSSLPQPFSSQPQFPIDLLIAVCLWESGHSLPLLSPAWICLPFPLLSSPSLSLFTLSISPSMQQLWNMN